MRKSPLSLTALAVTACFWAVFLLAGCKNAMNATNAEADSSYTVLYNGNGSAIGHAPVDNTNYTSGETVIVFGNPGNLERSGYTFVGWNTKTDGNGVTYSAGSSFSMQTSNVILYADWSLVPTYTVTYNKNGNATGTVPTDTTSYLAGQTATVLGNTGNLLLSDHIFAGWNTRADGTGTQYSPGQMLTIGSAEVTLFAVWRLAKFTVTYDQNGSATGSVPSDLNSYVNGQTVTVQGNRGGSLAWTGHALEGWNTMSDGTGTTYRTGQTFTMGSSNVTLHALWATSTPGLTFTANGSEYSVSRGTATSTDIEIPAFWNMEPVTAIAFGAFENFTTLQSVTVPSTVRTIAAHAFAFCTNLATVDLADGVTSIGDAAFSSCKYLLDFAMPNTVTALGTEVFADSNVSSITLSNSITTIPSGTFQNDTYLGIITIPPSVTSIGDSAFQGCTGVTVNFSNNTTSIGDFAFGSCTWMDNYTLPSRLVSIGRGAFGAIKAVTSITLPAHVASIGDTAFVNNPALTSVTVEAITPPVAGTTIFMSCPKLTAIHVPGGSAGVAAYKAAAGWSSYASLIQSP